MKSLTLLSLLGLGLVLGGCSSGDEGDKALDTASPMANVPAPPPGPAKKIPAPATMGGAPGGAPSRATAPGR